MTPRMNRRLNLGLAALLCGLLLPTAIWAAGKLQTLQIKLHQGANTLTLDMQKTVDLYEPWFKMRDIGEATHFGRYLNEGSVQIDMTATPPVSLAGSGTLTAANGDSIDWVLAVDPNNPEKIYVVPNTGTGRFEGATGYLDNFPISMTPGVDPKTGLPTITIIHWAEGELSIPKNTR